MPDPRAAPPAILAVDLDGTLLRSDMLVECFWAAVSQAPLALPGILAGLRGGRAAFKAGLAARAGIDVTRLPYDDAVIARVQAVRAAGGRTALVTATDQALAERIAAHLGIFDEVHGSTGRLNLKGAAKAAFLDGHFGAGTYGYIGDSAADLEVWKGTPLRIAVNARPGLARRIEALGPVEHLRTAPPRARACLRALRPHQWLKNLLVFVPALTAHQLDAATLLAALVAFAAFSLVASSVYVLNDLLDLSADRAHPRKRLRPFASGALPTVYGLWLAPGLLALGAGLAALLGGTFLLVMLGYWLATTLYSVWLKRRLVADICTLAGLYTLRIVAGGVATGLPLSVWLLAFSIFLFFSLASVKRQAELVDGKASGSASAHGREYHVDDLPIVAAMAIASGFLSVLVLALYLNTPAVVQMYSSPSLLWGICLVLLYWVSRNVMLAHRGRMHDDPVIFALKDGVSRACGLVILGLAGAGALL